MQLTVDTALGIAGVAISLGAAAMAGPPLLEMIYGRPRLEFGAEEFTDPDGKQLLIGMKNKITGRRLRRIGVERTNGDLLGYFDIQEQGTNRFIKKDVSGLMHCAPTRESGLLARALPGFSVGMSIVHAKGATTWICDAKADAFEPIGAGDYTALVTIICGEQVHRIRKNFKVGTAEHLTFWV